MNLKAVSNFNSTFSDVTVDKTVWENGKPSTSENKEKSSSVAFARSFTIDQLKYIKSNNEQFLNVKTKRKDSVEKKIADLVEVLNINHQNIKEAYNKKNKLERGFFSRYFSSRKIESLNSKINALNDEKNNLVNTLRSNSIKLVKYNEGINNSKKDSENLNTTIKNLEGQILQIQSQTKTDNPSIKAVSPNSKPIAAVATEVHQLAGNTLNRMLGRKTKDSAPSAPTLRYHANVDTRQHLKHEGLTRRVQQEVTQEITQNVSRALNDFALETIRKVSSKPTIQTEAQLRDGIIQAAKEHKPPITLTRGSIAKLVTIAKEFNQLAVKISERNEKLESNPVSAEEKKEIEKRDLEMMGSLIAEAIQQIDGIANHEIEKLASDIDSYSAQLVQANLERFNALSHAEVFKASSLQLPPYTGAPLPISDEQAKGLSKTLADKIAPQQGNYAAERLAKQAVKNMRGQDLRQTFSNEWNFKLPHQSNSFEEHPNVKPFLQELAAVAYESTQTIEKLPFPRSSVPLSLPSDPKPSLALLAKEMVKSIPEEYRSTSKTLALEHFFLGSLENLYQQQQTNRERVQQFQKEISPTLSTAINQSVAKSPEAAADVKAFEAHLNSSIQGFLFQGKSLVSADPALLARLSTQKVPTQQPTTWRETFGAAFSYVGKTLSEMMTITPKVLQNMGLQGEKSDFINASEVGKNVNQVMQDLEEKGLLVGVSIEKREELRHFIRKQMYQAAGVDRHHFFLQDNEAGKAFAIQMAGKMAESMVKKLKLSDKSEEVEPLAWIAYEVTLHVRQSMQNNDNVPFIPSPELAGKFQEILGRSGMSQKQQEEFLDAVAAEATKELKIDSDWSPIRYGASAQVQAALYAAAGLEVASSTVVQKVIDPDKTVQEIASYAQGTTIQLASRATEVADLLEESDGEKSNQALIVEHQVLPIWNGMMEQVKQERRDLKDGKEIPPPAIDLVTVERQQQLINQVTDHTMQLLFPKGLESIPVPQADKFFEGTWGETAVNLVVTGDRNYTNLVGWGAAIINQTILPNIFPALKDAEHLEQFLQSVESSHIEALEQKLGISIAPAMQAAKEVIQTQHGEERYTMAYQVLVYTLVRTNVQTTVKKQVNMLTSTIYKGEMVLGALKQVNASLKQVEEETQSEPAQPGEAQSQQEPKPAEMQAAPVPTRSLGLDSSKAYGESILTTVEALLPKSVEKVKQGATGRMIERTVGGKERENLEKFITHQIQGYVLGTLNQNLVSGLLSSQEVALAEQLNALNSPAAAQTATPDQLASQPQLPPQSNAYAVLQTAREKKLNKEIEAEVKEIKETLTSQLGSGLKSKLVIWGIKKALDVKDVDEVVDELVEGLNMITDHIDSTMVLEMAEGMTSELVKLDRDKTVGEQKAAPKREAKPSDRESDWKLIQAGMAAAHIDAARHP